MEIIEINTRQRIEFVELTSSLEKIVKRSQVKSGFCILFCPHTTAGLTINENADPSVSRDIIRAVEKLVPHKGDYLHLEGNADAHIKASLIGSSLQIIIEEGELVLGTWQGIYFCEFDGPRHRRVYLTLIKNE